MQNSGLAHLCRHDIHWEVCFDYAGRVQDIKAYKLAEEIETRLKYFGIVPDKLLPPALRKATADVQKRYAAVYKADDDLQLFWADWRKAKADWLKAYADWGKADPAALQVIHDKLWPDCPWNEEQQTMFPKKRDNHETTT